MEAPIKSTNRFFHKFLYGASAALLIGGLTYVVAPCFQPESSENSWPPQTTLITRIFELITAFWFFWLGGCFGSFLNVIVYRLPRHMSLMGVSRCPFCKHAVAPRDNVPVFAWLKLHGTCRHCRLPIAGRYPMVEFAVALLLLTLAITEVALGGANLSIESTRPFNGFSVNLFDPEWPLILSLLWHTSIGIILLGLALIVHDRSPIPPSMLVTGFFAIVVMATVHPTTLYAVRHLRAEPVLGTVLRDAALAASAGWAVGLLLRWEWDNREATDRSLAWMLAIAGGAFGWPLVLFCAIATPVLEGLCRFVAKVHVSPALILVGVIFFYIITGFPLLYPYLRTMPI